jgi:alpha-D-ribose 1-methylphosphonate 5-triphosphate synthase subunit PhnH
LRDIAVQGLNSAWFELREGWNASFPMGVDIVLLAGKQVMALPRTTRISTTRIKGA